MRPKADRNVCTAFFNHLEELGISAGQRITGAKLEIGTDLKARKRVRGDFYTAWPWTGSVTFSGIVLWFLDQAEGGSFGGWPGFFGAFEEPGASPTASALGLYLRGKGADDQLDADS